MKKKNLEKLMVFLISLLITGLIGYTILNGIQKAQEKIDDCKEQGDDGVKFVEPRNPFNLDLKCANFENQERVLNICERNNMTWVQYTKSQKFCINETHKCNVNFFPEGCELVNYEEIK
jgi:hypothetical protein